MIFSASIFNGWIRTVLRWFPIAGRNCDLRTTSAGTVISCTAKSELEHAWQVRCECLPAASDPTKREWRAFLRPGFVNGHDATIAEDRPDADTLQMISTEVPLTDETRPALVLSQWRNPVTSSGVGIDEDGGLTYGAGEGYPPFFDDKGVRPAALGGINSDAPLEDGRTREIRAIDIYLVVPRVATVATVTVLDPGTEAQSVSISTTFVNDYALSAASAYSLRAKAQWTAPREPDILERMEGTAVEPQTDELKIATVWMLSPPDAGEDAEPDETWTPYPQHFVFWNLMHASVNQLPLVPDNPLSLPTGLALGVGDALIAGLLSPLNDAFAQIEAYFAAANFAGQFYTI